MRSSRSLAVVALVLLGTALPSAQRRTLDIYWIDVEGGVLASRCEEDHDEVLECWYFYRRRGKPD